MHPDAPRLAITMGDPAGVGPEVVVKALAREPSLRRFVPVVFGEPAILEATARALGLPCPAVRQATTADLSRIRAGQVSAEAGQAAMECVTAAVQAVLAGECDAIVTAPLNKEALALAGCPFPGHTELLAHLTGTPRVGMLLIAGNLRVVHVSTHVSLQEAIERVTTARILECLRLGQEACLMLGISRPRLAVAGLNPHAGEAGLFGREERERIIPAVDAARDEGLDASGPHPPDTVFARAARGEFDLVVAMYHDQGHVAIKQHGFDDGVNVTIGLPVLRTSVDHGTAFDIAGQGVAREHSMLAALDVAAQMVEARAGRPGPSALARPSSCPPASLHLELPMGVFDFPHTPLPPVWTFEQLPRLRPLAPPAVEEATARAVDILAREARLPAGARIAVGVGSRGLDHLPRVVRATVERLRALGARPFIVPAMGSHGGATAEGQREILLGYGITPEEVGADIVSSMDTVSLGTLTEEEAPGFGGFEVCCDRQAASADGVILVNRIKPHTDFVGDLESGIAKMCAIGLGKREGATAIHTHGAHGLRHLLGPVARRIANRIPLLGGVALIENDQGRTAEIHALPGRDVAGEREKELSARARSVAPSLPFQDIDVLVVDRMGKDISGTGLDTHVIGRAHMPSIREEAWGGPTVRVLAVLDLTDPSHGNALGLGLADVTTRQLIQKVDWRATFVNLQTSREGGILRGRIPWVQPDSESCVRAAIATCGHGDPRRVRLVRIRDTAHLERLEISEALLPEALALEARLRQEQGAHPLDLALALR